MLLTLEVLAREKGMFLMGELHDDVQIARTDGISCAIS
jgi:hypothetical protein